MTVDGVTATANTCKQVALYFVTLPEGVNSLADCPEFPCIVDENGDPYDLGFDVDGNQCLVIPNPNPAKDPATYSTLAGEAPPAACCLTNFDIGVPAYDIDNECVTHVCMGEGLGWQPICGGDLPEPPPDPPDPTDTMDRVCYDLSGRTPAQYGGSGASWLVSTVDQFNDIDCPTGSGTAAPVDILRTSDYCVQQGTPPAPGTIPGFNFTSTGQNTVIDGLDGTYVAPCDRPTFYVDFGAPTGTGPIEIEFELTAGSGTMGFWVYNTCTDSFEGIATVSGPSGSSHSVQSSTYGDWLRVFTNTGVVGVYTIELADTGLDPACVDLIAAAVNDPRGGDANDASEIVENISMAFTPTGETDCCFTASDASEIAALLTAEDPAGNTWTATGNLVCSDMPLGQGAIYANLTMCDGAPIDPTVTTF